MGLNYPSTDVNCKDKEGKTLLINGLSCLTEQTYEYIRSLLEDKNADPLIGDLHGNTPLHYLASKSLDSMLYQHSNNTFKKEKNLENAKNLYTRFMEILIKVGGSKLL